MADPKVAITISAKDQASKQFKAVGSAGAKAGKAIAQNWKAAAAGIAAAGVGLEAMARQARDTNVELEQMAIAMDTDAETLRQLALETSNVTFPLKDVTQLFKLAGQQGLETGAQLQEFATFWDTVADAINGNAVALAENAIGLQAFGVAVGNEAEAMAALGFIQSDTTAGVEKFLQTLTKLAPDAEKVGVSINEMAAIIGILEKRGLSGRVAIAELNQVMTTAEGREDFLRGMNLNNKELQAMVGNVEAAEGKIQDMANVVMENMTMTERATHALKEFAFQHGELMQAASMLSGPLMAIATGITAIGLAGPVFVATATKIIAQMKLIQAEGTKTAIALKGIGKGVGVMSAAFIGWEVGTILGKFTIIQKGAAFWAFALSQAMEIIQFKWEQLQAVFSGDTLEKAFERHEARLASYSDALDVMLEETTDEWKTAEIERTKASEEAVEKRIAAEKKYQAEIEAAIVKAKEADVAFMEWVNAATEGVAEVTSEVAILSETVIEAAAVAAQSEWIVPEQAVPSEAFERVDEFAEHTRAAVAETRNVFESATAVAQGLFSGLASQSAEMFDRLISEGYSELGAQHAVTQWWRKQLQASNLNIAIMGEGGIVTAPTLALIGDDGPEKVIPLGRGDTGSGTTINNFNFSGIFTAEPDQMRQLTRELLPFIETENARAL
jgi:hypothetical protein